MFRLLFLFFALFAVQANAASTAIANYNTVACLQKSDVSRGIELGQSGDQEAYVSFLSELIMQEKCAMIHAGDKVFVEDISMMSGLACIRPRGSTKCYWVEYEAIQSR